MQRVVGPLAYRRHLFCSIASSAAPLPAFLMRVAASLPLPAAAAAAGGATCPRRLAPPLHAVPMVKRGSLHRFLTFAAPTRSPCSIAALAAAALTDGVLNAPPAVQGLFSALPNLSLRAQNLDIEVFGSLDSTKSGRAKTSIKPRCIGLWMAHSRSQAEGSAASMACVVPHGIRSLALSASHEDSQKNNSSNVVPVICHIARYFFVGRFISTAAYGSCAKKRC